MKFVICKTYPGTITGYVFLFLANVHCNHRRLGRLCQKPVCTKPGQEKGTGRNHTARCGQRKISQQPGRFYRHRRPVVGSGSMASGEGGTHTGRAGCGKQPKYACILPAKTGCRKAKDNARFLVFPVLHVVISCHTRLPAGSVLRQWGADAAAGAFFIAQG